MLKPLISLELAETKEQDKEWFAGYLATNLAVVTAWKGEPSDSSTVGAALWMRSRLSSCTLIPRRIRSLTVQVPDSSWFLPLSGKPCKELILPSQASLTDLRALKTDTLITKRCEVHDLKGSVQYCYQCGQHSTRRALVTSCLSTWATLLHATPSQFCVIT